jgi:hypothetical protein
MKSAGKCLLSTILGFLTFLLLPWLGLFYTHDYRPKLEANRAIEKFHKQMNDGEFGQIRDDASSYSSLGRRHRIRGTRIAKARHAIADV